MSRFIHRFIHSMTFREKSYFKRFAVRHSEKEKNYLRLFDSINKMETYSEEALKEEFSGESIAKYFSGEMKYLKEQLFKSLSNYYFDKTPANKMQKLILFTELLISKGFQKQAYKTLKKAKHIAYHYEDFSTILKLIQLEEDILFNQGILGYTEKLGELKMERQPIYDKIQNLNDLRLLREQVREFQYQGFINDTEKHPQFYQDTVLQSPENALSSRAKGHWYYIWSLLFYLNRNYAGCLKVTKEGYKMMEQHKQLFPDTEMLPINSNILYFSALCHDRNSFDLYYEKLNLFDGKNSLNLTYIKYIRHIRRLELFYQLGDEKGTLALLPQVESFLHTHRAHLKEAQINTCFFASVRGCIVTGQFERGIKLLNEWLRTKVIGYTIIPASLFKLILHLELGWEILLESEIKSVQQLLRQKKKQNVFTNTFLKFIKTCLKNTDQRLPDLNSLIIEINDIKTNPERNQDFEDFDYLNWCKRKLAHYALDVGKRFKKE